MNKTQSVTCERIVAALANEIKIMQDSTFKHEKIHSLTIHGHISNNISKVDHGKAKNIRPRSVAFRRLSEHNGNKNHNDGKAPANQHVRFATITKYRQRIRCAAKKYFETPPYCHDL